MQIAFAIVNLFAGGGLQRDCMALARKVRARGHAVTIFTARTSGDIPADLDVEILRNEAWTNHRRNRQFAADLNRRCAGRFDRIVGFNKLSRLDLLYCADPSVAARSAGHLRGWLPRVRALTALEASCFARGQGTRLLLLSQAQADAYRQSWGTEPERITVLSPTIDIRRRQPQHRDDGTRAALRTELGIGPDRWVWLAICLQPQVKGLDRTLDALQAQPDAILIVAGLGDWHDVVRALPRWRGPSAPPDRVRLLGQREDIPQLMAAADLLVHPARYDTTGTVILEAVANGLPVVTTAMCGYAEHVDAANSGVVLPEPFDSARFAAALADMHKPDRWAQRSRNAIRYGGTAALYGGLDQATDIILG